MAKKNKNAKNKGEPNDNNLDMSQQDMDDEYDDDEEDDEEDEQEENDEENEEKVDTKDDFVEDDEQKSPQQNGISSVFMTPSSIIGSTKSNDISPSSTTSNYSPNVQNKLLSIKKEQEQFQSSTPPLVAENVQQNWHFYNNFDNVNHFNNHYFNNNAMLQPLSASSPSYLKSNYNYQQQQQQQDLYYNQRLQYSMPNSVPFTNTNIYSSNAWSTQYDQTAANMFASISNNQTAGV